ncbi:MAG TPA: type II CAAX endopeptidase family protein [Conexibacter sp.]|nr:type II CAAX endopeptidase family protein [Conexibacter sp.]
MSSASSYGPWLPPVAGSPGGPPAPPGRPPAEGGEPRWAPSSAWLALFAALAFAIFGAVVVGVVGAVFGASLRSPPPAVNIVATVVQDGAFIGAALLFAGRAGAVLPAQFGFVRTRLGAAIGWMALAYLGYIVLSALWAAVFNTAKTQDNLPTSLGVNESTAALVAVCVVVTTIAPFAEETFFRGFFFGALRNWRGPWPAAVVTGVAFGAIHYGSAPDVFLVPLGIFGFALCLVREQTGSLLPCIALHAINNALAFGSSESWTAGQTLLLMGGAASVTMLVCQLLVSGRARAV